MYGRGGAEVAEHGQSRVERGEGKVGYGRVEAQHGRVAVGKVRLRQGDLALCGEE